MKWVHISVEGPTEESFVKNVLSDHLNSFEIQPTPIILTTATLPQGKKYQGGIISYKKARKEILHLLQDSSVSAVSTMYDFYGLKDDFPGMTSIPNSDCFSTINHLEKEMKNDISDPRFRPYIQLHEFEALLFSNPDAIAEILSDQNLRIPLIKIRNQFNSPEEINNDPSTAPSKRITNLYPGYEKPFHGILTSIHIGLKDIRSQCTHFNEWLTWMEKL